MAKTGRETMPTPEIAEGRVCAIINNKPKNSAILMDPKRTKIGQCFASGILGLNASNNKPAGKARIAPNNSGGQPGREYCVTA